MHYDRSLTDPEGYWAEAAEQIHWTKKWDKVLDRSNVPFYRWFAGGELNACYNAIDRHLLTRADQNAIIYDSPLTGKKAKLSYSELHARVERFAGVLRNLGVEKGDIVLIYMPMIPEATVAMMACARLGAVHTVVFGGFASEQLAIRLNHAQPKVVVTASCGVEPTRLVPYKPLLDAAIQMSAWKPKSVVVYQRADLPKATELVAGRDQDWEQLLTGASAADCVPVLSTDPLYMIYTSGTTGTPKAIVRDTGGYCVAMTWSLQHAFNLNPGDTIFTASDIGWVVGHSYIVYGPLIHGLTGVLYEGKPTTPDAGAFWRAISEHKVNCFFTAPTAFRTVKREDPEGKLIAPYDMSSLKSIWVAGEHADPNTIHWLQDHFPGLPIVDNAWQTETGWPITANPLGLEEHPVKPGSSCRPMSGYALQVLRDDGSSADPGELGNLAIKLPLPPGTLPTLFKNDEGFKKCYLSQFPGYYCTGDAGLIDHEGFVYFMTRTDDIINVSGIRLSTGAMEEILSEHPDVAECAVIGPKDDIRGQVPVGFIVLKSNASKAPGAIVQDVLIAVRDRIGPVSMFRSCAVVPHLPKTRSGKVLRKTMKHIADGDSYVVPGTIENEATLETIRAALEKFGYAKEHHRKEKK